MDDFTSAARAVGYFLHCKRAHGDPAAVTKVQRDGDTLSRYVGQHHESCAQLLKLGEQLGKRNTDAKSAEQYPALRYYAAVAFTPCVPGPMAQRAAREWSEMLGRWVESGRGEAAVKHAVTLLQKNPTAKSVDTIVDTMVEVGDKHGHWASWSTYQKRAMAAMTLHEAVPANLHRPREALVVEAAAALTEMSERIEARQPRLNIYGTEEETVSVEKMAKAQCKVAKFVAVNTPVGSKQHQQAAQLWDQARDMLVANSAKPEDPDVMLLKLGRAYSLARQNLSDAVPYQNSSFCRVVAKHIDRVFETLAGIDHDVAMDTVSTAFAALSPRARPQVVNGRGLQFT